jgi:hypothetical protein
MSEVDYEDTETLPEDQMKSDYDDMVSRFIEGTEAENDFSNAKLISKRLFEENGVLCGEVIFEFSDIAQAKLYKFNKTGPLMYFSSDSVFSSNGTKGPEFMPVVFWDKNEKTIEVTTNISTTEGESLLSIWQANK